jgi:hypothetical protein
LLARLDLPSVDFPKGGGPSPKPLLTPNGRHAGLFSLGAIHREGRKGRLCVVADQRPVSKTGRRLEVVSSEAVDELRLAPPELVELASDQEREVVRLLAGLFVAAARRRGRSEVRAAA